MIKQIAVMFLLLCASDAASAQEEDKTIYVIPRPVSEEAKILALKLAYEANGNSMVGFGRMIDLTVPPQQQPPPLTDEIMPAPKSKEKRK